MFKLSKSNCLAHTPIIKTIKYATECLLSIVYSAYLTYCSCVTTIA